MTATAIDASLSVRLLRLHPLIAFRALFGALMASGALRFVANGWVESLILAPRFHFHYWGFEWVQPPAMAWLAYLLYGAMFLCALGIAFGVRYRLALAGFLLTFTYAELIDKAYYLNHYYLTILLALLMLLLPLDARRADTPPPAWALHVLRALVALVWFFAGLAKVNPDWLLRAQPLQMWLSAQHDFPLIAPFLEMPFTAYLMSWAGAFYDLTIPLWLLWKPTRPWAFLAAFVFHALTALLFPQIGIFPYVMLACTLLFLPSHVSSLPRFALPPSRPMALFLLLFFALQVALPLRHWLYPGDVLWNEEGYRFSWRVMLVEKSGTVVYTLRDPATGAEWQVYPEAYLTPLQAKQMAFQPDMILEFAHFLAREAGREGVEVRANAWVAFNGRPSRLLIDPAVDLARESWGFGHHDWVLQ